MDVLHLNAQISGYFTLNVCNSHFSKHFRGYITFQQVPPCKRYENEMNYVTRKSNLFLSS